MATSARHRADRASLLLRKGQEFYSLQQYDRAESTLLRAMDLCSCGVAIQDQPRIDDDISQGIEKKMLKEVLAKMSASSKRCDNRIHVDALDSLIATYEMQGRLDESVQFAARMINLSPREPKSYLRLGKILRLKNQQTLAYYTYKQGIELVKRKHPDHALLDKLKVQKDKVLPLVTFDPINTLPVELVAILFKSLDFKMLCASLRVSKTWKTVLTGDSLSGLWKVQKYKFTRMNHPGITRMSTSFKAYSGYAAGAVTELSIDGCSRFLEYCKLPRVLQYSKNLKILKLRETQTTHALQELPWEMKHLQLTNIHLGCGVRPTPRLLQQLLVPSSGSLEELSIFELPFPDEELGTWYSGWPRLEKLKIVRFSTPKGSGLSYNLNLRVIMNLAPNVEEAWLDLIEYRPMELKQGWPKLRRLFVGNCNNRQPGIIVTEEDDGCFNEDMRELHLEGYNIYVHFCRSNDSSDPQTHALISQLWSISIGFDGPVVIPHLPRLEKLSLLFFVPLGPPDFESIVRPSLESGTLRELDIRPLPVKSFFQAKSAPTVPHWFRGEHITFLSLTGFTQERLHEHKLFEAVVLAIVDGFPNLQVVDVGNELIADTLLAKLIVRGIRTIYYRGGETTKDDLRDWATAKYGARLVKGPPPYAPSCHPDRQPGQNLFLQ